nr:hypothetical protein [Clostridia bacterium]
MNMNEYLWKSSDAASEMRLLVEGAIALYEEDAMSLQSLARDNRKPEAATAFDTIGTALYNLREHLRNLQAMQVAVTEDRVSER